MTRKRGLHVIPLTLDSKRIIDFLWQTGDFPSGKKGPVEYSPVCAYLQERGSHIHLMLEIGDKTTGEDLRKAIHPALEYRDRLLEFQGPMLEGGQTLFLEELWIMRTYDKLPPAKIAKRLNAILSELLRVANEYQGKHPKLPPVVLYYVERNPCALDHARNLLRMMKYPDSEIDLLLEDAFDNMAEGEPPFPPNSPCDREMVKDRIRSWQQGKLHRSTKSSFYEATPHQP